MFSFSVVSFATLLRALCVSFFFCGFLVLFFSLFCPAFTGFVLVFLFLCFISFFPLVFYFTFFYLCLFRFHFSSLFCLLYKKVHRMLLNWASYIKKIFTVYYEKNSQCIIKMFIVYDKNVYLILWNFQCILLPPIDIRCCSRMYLGVPQC